MKLLTALAAGTLALASFAGPADAAITYTFDLPVGSVGHIGGTLTTNGDLGTLDQSDILSWNFNVVGDGATDTLTDANSGVELLGTGLTATDTELSFDFDAGSSLLFQKVHYSGANYICFQGTSGPCVNGISAIPVTYGSASQQFSSPSGSVVIASVTAAVPEASSWALMILGLGAIGHAARRRAKTAARFA